MLEALGVVEIRRGLCTVISANPEQGYLNVMLSHLYLNSGNEEELQVFRRTVESAYTTLAIDAATEQDIAAIQASLELFRGKKQSGQLTADDDLAFHSQILLQDQLFNGFHDLTGQTFPPRLLNGIPGHTNHLFTLLY